MALWVAPPLASAVTVIPYVPAGVPLGFVVGPELPEPPAQPNQTRHPRNKSASNGRVFQVRRLPVRPTIPTMPNANRIGKGKGRYTIPSEPRVSTVIDTVREVVLIVSVMDALLLPGVTEPGAN